jgi:hypothetical protein
MRQRVPFVGDQADVLISAFGATDLLEFAPVINLLSISIVTAASPVIRLFYAAAVGSTADNQIEIFNQAVPPGAIAGSVHVSLIGGQGGCQRAWRDEVTGATWTLRMTITGLGGGDAGNARIEWMLGRGVT